MTEAMMHKTTDRARTETDIGEQVETITHDIKKLGRMAGDTAKSKLTEVRDRGVQMCDDVGARTRQAVERRPWVALAVAAGVGALAGLLLARR